MMAVSIKSAGGNLEIGAPTALFDSRMVVSPTIGFDVSKDGRFLIPSLDENAGTPLTLVVNWQTGLKK